MNVLKVKFIKNKCYKLKLIITNKKVFLWTLKIMIKNLII